jgi:hypothetical protein
MNWKLSTRNEELGAHITDEVTRNFWREYEKETK